MLEKALDYAQKAVQLDPLDQQAYRALFAARFASGDMKGFREAAERAVHPEPKRYRPVGGLRPASHHEQ